MSVREPDPSRQRRGTGFARAGQGTEATVPSDLRLSRVLWPILLASAVGLLPFTVFSPLLVPVSEGAGVAAVGSLRGLGGVAALLVGAGLAPLIGRDPRERTAAASTRGRRATPWRRRSSSTASGNPGTAPTRTR